MKNKKYFCVVMGCPLSNKTVSYFVFAKDFEEVYRNFHSRFDSDGFYHLESIYQALNDE